MKNHQSKLIHVIFSVVAMAFIVISCAQITLLRDTPTQSADEEAIVSLLTEYEKMVNTYQWNKLPELFTNGGMLNKMDPKEYIDKNMSSLSRFGNSKCKIAFRSPKSINIEGNTGTVILGRKISCNNKYNEFRIEVEKSNDIWLIRDFNQK